MSPWETAPPVLPRATTDARGGVPQVTMGPRPGFVDIDLVRDAFAVHELGRYDLLLYLTLATYADRVTRECYPSIAKIQDRCGLDKRAIRASMSNLETLGVVTLIRRNRKPAIVRLVPLTRDESVPSDDSTRDETVPSTRYESAPDMVQIGTQTRDESVPLTKEASNEVGEARERPSRYCIRHPNGTEYGVPCGPCGDARKALEIWEKAQFRRSGPLTKEQYLAQLCPEPGHEYPLPCELCARIAAETATEGGTQNVAA